MKVKNFWFWVIAGISVAIDQLTKLTVIQTMELSQSIPILPGIFHFTYVRNTGAAFSLFANGGGWWLRWLSLVVSLGLMAWAIWHPRLPRLEQWGYGFILGGAIGNGVDRFLLGYVVDFLDFRLINFPVFNIADISINLGIICLLIATFFSADNSSRDDRT
ncbi:MAG: lipoprotein signal peptidase [Coleofasciculaceae cyanobacterium SM2_1_6]|nr:lipoprotein signal peptidase [Coleofasciculaceae cyanobacterium SM2_1_6]